VRIPRGDANEVLKTWCRERNWHEERAVVFLDPYGMQVEWSTIERLAETKGVDLWYLFPLGVGVARLLTHRGDMSEAWQMRLDLLFGTSKWRERFYQSPAFSALLCRGKQARRQFRHRHRSRYP
jgi:three-Cys-motif partner protein